MGFLAATEQGSQSTFTILQSAIFLNIFLAVLNMIPVPPLDGSKVFLDVLKNYSSKLFIQVSRFFKQYQLPLFFALLAFVFYTNILGSLTFSIYSLYTSLLF